MNIRAIAILGGIEEVQPWDSIFPFEISNLHTLVDLDPYVDNASPRGRGGKKRDKLKLKQQRKSRRRNR